MARTKAVAAPPTLSGLRPGDGLHTWMCATCGHRLLRVRTPEGTRVLDTAVVTWVLAVVKEEGQSLYYRSRSYPEHQCQEDPHA